MDEKIFRIFLNLSQDLNSLNGKDLVRRVKELDKLFNTINDDDKKEIYASTAIFKPYEDAKKRLEDYNLD